MYNLQISEAVLIEISLHFTLVLRVLKDCL
jgi:hypothetical protein